MTNYPVCRVDVHGRDDTYRVTLSGVEGGEPSGDLLSCMTTKRIGMDTAAGTFELQFARTRDAEGRTWAEKLHAQDLVVIQMMNHTGALGPDGAGEMHTVMIGLIDHVTETTGLNQRGQPQRRVLVRGRDFAKVFLNGMVTYWNFLGAALLDAQTFVDVSRFNAKPAVIIRDLLSEIYERFMRATIRFNGVDLQLWDFLAYDLSSYDAELPAGLDMKFIGGEGSFWSFFIRVASPPFHELFIDTRRTTTTDTATTAGIGRETKAAKFTLGQDHAAPTLVLRPTPFPYFTPPEFPQKFRGVQELDDEGFLVVPDTVVHGVVDRPWDDLVRHEIGHHDGLREEPLSEELSQSDSEVYNMYMPLPVYPVLSERFFLLSAPPILDPERFHRYGYRPLTPQCALIQPKASADYAEPMFEFYTRLAWRLASWNVLNDTFLSGTKTLQLSPHLHIGERLVDRSSWQKHAMEFYIEAVVHRFVYGEQASTTVALTRGLPEVSYARFGSLEAAQGLKPVDPTRATQVYKDLMDRAQKVQH